MSIYFFKRVSVKPIILKSKFSKVSIVLNSSKWADIDEIFKWKAENEEFLKLVEQKSSMLKYLQLIGFEDMLSSELLSRVWEVKKLLNLVKSLLLLLVGNKFKLEGILENLKALSIELISSNSFLVTSLNGNIYLRHKMQNQLELFFCKLKSILLSLL